MPLNAVLAALDQVVVRRNVVPFGAVADQFEEPFDRRQGSLQFVAQRAHELQPDFVAFFRQSPRLLGQHKSHGRLLDGVPQFVGRKRFGQEVVGSAFHRPHRGLDRGVGGDHDRQHLAVPIAHLVEHVESADAGHLVVEDQDVGRPLLDFRQGSFARLGVVNLQHGRGIDVGDIDAEIAQHAAHSQPHPRLVVRHQNVQCLHRITCRVVG